MVTHLNRLLRVQSQKVLKTQPADFFFIKLPGLINHRMLGKNFSRRQFEIVFLYFFQENRIRHFMQIVSLGDNLKEVSDPIF